MADIELVIKMPEELKEALDNIKKENAFSYMWVYGDTIYNAIKNGIPLPKGHGDLIDVNSACQIIRPIEPSDAEWGMTAETAKQIIYDAFKKAPTIIEADKESENK